MKEKYYKVILIVLLICIGVLLFLNIYQRIKESSPTISFDMEKVDIKVGESKVLIPVINNIDNYTLTWTSSNPNVARVNDSIVYGVSKGSTSITAKINNSNASATIMVFVDDIYPESIVFAKKEVTLYIGEESVLNYTILPIDTTSKDVLWEIENNSLLKITDGKAIPLKLGETSVTVKTSNGLSDKCLVKVVNKEIDINTISFDKDSYSVNLGETLEIKTTISPSNATNQELIWTSSDNSIATVDKGIVYPKGKGNVTITATDTKGKVKKTVNVSVKGTTIVNPSEITIVGDSRMAQLCGYDWYKSEGGSCIAKTSMGYNWFVDTAIHEVDALPMNKKKNIVLNLGVNDLSHIGKYITKYRELVLSKWKDYHVFLLSVNPTSGKRADMNSKIISFNNTMKSNLMGYSNITYCDSYQHLQNIGFSTSDGVHYVRETSKNIYDYIKKCISDYYNE